MSNQQASQLGESKQSREITVMWLSKLYLRPEDVSQWLENVITYDNLMWYTLLKPSLHGAQNEGRNWLLWKRSDHFTPSRVARGMVFKRFLNSKMTIKQRHKFTPRISSPQSSHFATSNKQITYSSYSDVSSAKTSACLPYNQLPGKNQTRREGIQ